MRWASVILCLLVAACASEPLPPLPEALAKPTLRGPPDAAALRAGVERVVTETKLTGVIEVSELRQAHALAPAEWIVCVRSNDPKGLPRYAVFFREKLVIEYRIGVALDGCDRETYRRFGKKK